MRLLLVTLALLLTAPVFADQLWIGDQNALPGGNTEAMDRGGPHTAFVPATQFRRASTISRSNPVSMAAGAATTPCDPIYVGNCRWFSLSTMVSSTGTPAVTLTVQQSDDGVYFGSFYPTIVVPLTTTAFQKRLLDLPVGRWVRFTLGSDPSKPIQWKIVGLSKQ